MSLASSGKMMLTASMTIFGLWRRGITTAFAGPSRLRLWHSLPIHVRRSAMLAATVRPLPGASTRRQRGCRAVLLVRRLVDAALRVRHALGTEGGQLRLLRAFGVVGGGLLLRQQVRLVLVAQRSDGAVDARPAGRLNEFVGVSNAESVHLCAIVKTQ